MVKFSVRESELFVREKELASLVEWQSTFMLSDDEIRGLGDIAVITAYAYHKPEIRKRVFFKAGLKDYSVRHQELTNEGKFTNYDSPIFTSAKSFVSKNILKLKSVSVYAGGRLSSLSRVSVFDD